MKRFDLRDEIHHLDHEADCVRIMQILNAQEFPWDMGRALGIALYRTYAVPSIGGLLGRTDEFTGSTQKRYDDTALILNNMMRYGFEPGQGRDALRRMNQMHRSYDISNDDYRYVLSTFVVMPVRWINDHGYGWRRLSEHEISAITHYYRRLGRYMGIKDIPESYAQFRELLDSYEREHFAYTEGGRAVSDATLDLMVSFYPRRVSGPARKFSMAILDESLIETFRYEPPSRAWRLAAHLALRLRALVVRRMKPREEPLWAEDNPNIRSYPEGYDVNRIGTFPAGCPVAHDVDPVAHEELYGGGGGTGGAAPEVREAPGAARPSATPETAEPSPAARTRKAPATAAEASADGRA
ncbi:oxygenase MpaB family protein [Nocardiopsis sp. HUAS JQ3]|uniref:oxygenase MpaB family protein n=1 Tax=Nocardiopsis sp. HUAS JQ3 TaxID=3061629 RepID=UPI0023A9A1BD|nr:oxygenase MpaB family protein [Nocardiopsis sp. HUAS JQ3]WDZ91967.1 oxygenase MpaB family protein [Nocardiopsis sp. HUAS JQ3]